MQYKRFVSILFIRTVCNCFYDGKFYRLFLWKLSRVNFIRHTLSLLLPALELDNFYWNRSGVMFAQIASEHYWIWEKYLMSRYIKVSLIQKVGRVRSDVSKEYIRLLIHFESTLLYMCRIYLGKDSACARIYSLKGIVIFLHQTSHLTFAKFLILRSRVSWSETLGTLSPWEPLELKPLEIHKSNSKATHT